VKDHLKYRAVLIEIKKRTQVLDRLIEGSIDIMFPATTVETCCLQVRKIIELITFSSLIASKDEYSAVQAKFAQHWNSKLIIADLERIHPNFYPQPVLQVDSERPGITHDLLPRGDDYLTKDELIAAYEECGGMMHAENPFGKKKDYVAYETKIKGWRNKIVNLLNVHIVTLIGDPRMYLFQMGTDNSPPLYTPFGLVDEDNPNKRKRSKHRS